MRRFHKQNFKKLCNQLGQSDKELQDIISAYGYPPIWTRPNHFASLIHIILEQQVSLASAKAAFIKLEEYVGEISPAAILKLSDEELRNCYFSRQKTIYARELAKAIKKGTLSLEELATKDDEVVREELKKVKGIGDWTVDIYLLFVLQRCDVFPTGDLAMIKSLKQIKNLPASTGKEKLLEIAEEWKPYRSLATYLLWHHYLESRKKKN